MAEHDNFIIVRLSIFLSVFIRVPVCLSFCLSLCLSVFCHTLSETNVKKKKKKMSSRISLAKLTGKVSIPEWNHIRGNLNYLRSYMSIAFSRM